MVVALFTEVPTNHLPPQRSVLRNTVSDRFAWMGERVTLNTGALRIFSMEPVSRADESNMASALTCTNVVTLRTCLQGAES